MGLSFRKHEPQTTDAYVSDLTRTLRRSLPQEKAEQIAQEVQAHIFDQVEELISSGVTRAEAEAQTIAGFGALRTYSRAVTFTAYEDRSSARWRLAGRLAAVNLIAALSLHQMGYDLPLHWLPSLSLLLIPLAALGARLPQTRTYAAYVAAAAAMLFVGAGIRFVPHASTPTILLPYFLDGYNPLRGGVGVRRENHQQEIAYVETQKVKLSKEIQLLRLGINTYASDAPVPAPLMQNGRYVVPIEYSCQDGLGGVGIKEQDIAAFQLLRSGGESQTSYRQRQLNTPYETVATRQAAKAVWIRDGHKWLASKRYVFATSTADQKYLRSALSAAFTFNTGAASYYAAACVQWGLCLLLVDFLMAHLGRAVWMSIRNRRRPQTAQF